MGLAQDIFKEGLERWVKFRYVNTDKCIKAFATTFKTHVKDNWDVLVEKQGYEVLEIGCTDQFEPQVAALFDIKTNLVGLLHGRIEDYMLQEIIDIITSKMDEIKERTTKKKL